MFDKADVEGWLLDYACCHREIDVLKAISLRHPGSIDFHEKLGVPTIRYTTAIIHHIVDRCVLESFSLACSLIDDIYCSLKQHIPFDLYAKLSFGLKMQSLFYELKNGTSIQALAKLNEFFPRTGTNYTHATTKQLSKLTKVTGNFRKFFLPLLANEKQRKSYMCDEYPEEFGPKYMETLTKLGYEFLNSIEELLPSPIIQKILDIGVANIPVQSLSYIGFEILLDYCVDKVSLTRADLLDILISISPLSTQDRVATDLIFKLSGSTKSDSDLFENDDDSMSILSTQPPSQALFDPTTNHQECDYTRLRTSQIADTINDTSAPCTSEATPMRQEKGSPDVSVVKNNVDMTDCRLADVNSNPSPPSTFTKSPPCFYKTRSKISEINQNDTIETRGKKRSRVLKTSVNDRRSKQLKMLSQPSDNKNMGNGTKNGDQGRSKSTENDSPSSSSSSFVWTPAHCEEKSVDTCESSSSCHSRNTKLILSKKNMTETRSSHCKSKRVSEELMIKKAIEEGLVSVDYEVEDLSDVYYNIHTCKYDAENSVSDINNITCSSTEEDLEKISNSGHSEPVLNIDDAFYDVLNSIVQHRKQPFLRLCVVKLFRNKILEATMNEKRYQIYS